MKSTLAQRTLCYVCLTLLTKLKRFYAHVANYVDLEEKDGQSTEEKKKCPNL